ncbi:glycerophosphoryl diester phosphodiesterase [Ichthyobacterium seriolicida]|uniref:Glycerophosphoryl diester phosphodiesterase n=2 Tax=Ichthyobacterium seriolicida TaxID=242600 RepID=A0A1J1E798_9FLAO|nr:glycerophosphoryl diester phosphodiesterase [Ichthyobacterium seriolicida]
MFMVNSFIALGQDYDSVDSNKLPLKKLSPSALKVRDYVKADPVIAHRGTTFWAPEETEAAFRWARNIGADYIEVDVQMTKDGVLLALHDDNLNRTTNIKEVYPDRANYNTSKFTLEELRNLDAGSWFNKEKPKNARKSFVNQKISTLEDVFMIAEGYRIKRDEKGLPLKDKRIGREGHYLYEKDPYDNGHRPGVYMETKEPQLFKGIEEVLKAEIKKMGWLVTDSPKEIPVFSNKVGVANTNGRVILQSFSRESIKNLEKYLSGIPKCLLLWKDDMVGKGSADSFADNINFSVENNVHIMGVSIAGAPNNYDDLCEPWMCEMIHKAQMLVHAYSFDTDDQLKRYNGDYYYTDNQSRFENKSRKPKKNLKLIPKRSMFIDGIFTNLSDQSLIYYNRLNTNDKTAINVLNELGY